MTYVRVLCDSFQTTKYAPNIITVRIQMWFNLGSQIPPVQRIAYYQVQMHLSAKTITNAVPLIISTLVAEQQQCLISNTVPIFREEQVINDMLTDMSTSNRPVVIYGRNSTDESVYKKYTQLQQCGLSVSIYTGGLFEWLLLRDVYGDKDFPIIGSTDDLLVYS